MSSEQGPGEEAARSRSVTRFRYSATIQEPAGASSSARRSWARGSSLRWSHPGRPWAYWARRIAEGLVVTFDCCEACPKFSAETLLVAAGHRSVVAFSHGATIRAWSAARVSNLSADFVAANPLQNLGGVLVEGSPEKGWKALSYQAHNLSGPRTIPLEGATARPSGLGRSSQKPNHATTGGAPGMSPREPDAAEPSLLTDKRPDLHWRDAPPTAASPSPRRHSRKREALPALAELFARRPDLELFRTAAVLEEHVRWGA